MKERVKGLVLGIIIGVMIAATSVMASNGKIQKILNYNNIKITMNGQEVKPTDANGNYVEPFIIDGTTYLPVRGVADALGLYVEWDGETKTVKLSESPFVVEEELGEKTETEMYVDTYGALVAESMRAAFETGSGLKCNCIIEGKGNELIIKLCINALDELSDSDKAEMQSLVNASAEEFKAEFDSFKEIIPSLKKVTFVYCTKDGTPVATVSAEY